MGAGKPNPSMFLFVTVQYIKQDAIGTFSDVISQHYAAMRGGASVAVLLTPSKKIPFDCKDTRIQGLAFGWRCLALETKSFRYVRFHLESFIQRVA